MKLRRIVEVIGILLIVTGCASQGAVSSVHRRQATFLEGEYAPYSAKGRTGRVTGQAFLKTQGGDVKFGAGSSVIIVPVTSYSREWFEVRVLNDKAITPADPRAEEFTRATLADGEGRFTFDKLPEGTYYVACYISWKVPGLRGTMSPTGGWAFATANVDSGGQTAVIATRPDLATLRRVSMAGSLEIQQTPLGDPFTVRLESGEAFGAKGIWLRNDGTLKVVLPTGDVRYLNSARVALIIDSDGNDRTRAVLLEHKRLGDE